MAKFSRVVGPIVIQLGYREPKHKILPDKGYCSGCGIYAPLRKRDLESGTCKYCRQECKGSTQWPPSGEVVGKFAKCDFCTGRVSLNAEGRMVRHTC